MPAAADQERRWCRWLWRLALDGDRPHPAERAEHRGGDQPRPDRILTARSTAITAKEARMADPAAIGRSGRALAHHRERARRDAPPKRPAEPDTRSRKPSPCQLLHPPHATDDKVQPNRGECQVLQALGARVRVTRAQPTPRAAPLAAPATPACATPRGPREPREPREPRDPRDPATVESIIERVEHQSGNSPRR
jgi:hypothetical protein